MTRLRTNLLQGPLRRRFLTRPEWLLGDPPGHNRWSAIIGPRPIDSDPTFSDHREVLLDLAFASAQYARNCDLSSIGTRRDNCPDSAMLPIWPGEHYRLLAGLAASLGEGPIVEVGTYRGAGTLALLHGGASSVLTYDLLAWDSFNDSLLLESDFGGQLEQRLGDLADPEFLVQQVEDLQEARLVFVDAPKDGVFEYKFRDLVMPRLSSGTVLLFDDIRLMNMLDFWWTLPYPSIDITCMGHHTGTGLAVIP